MQRKIVILGAGPAGLGAGLNLSAQTKVSWQLFEATGRVGGLASSRVDKNGFTWDLGGHVIFSSNRFFNSVVEKSIGENGLTHTRKSFVRMGNRFIPFPLQNNIHRLPKRAMQECFEGMKDAIKNRRKPKNFEEWIECRLGFGLAKNFMFPYNDKVWTYPLDGMGFGWIDGRVSLPPIKSVKESIRLGSDVTGWGPNATFRFPFNGGTGAFFKTIAKPFHHKIALRHEAVSIDPLKRKITFKNGTSTSYSSLITTAPLDILATKLLINPPPNVVEAAGELKSNSGWMVGIGINRKIKSQKCWVYFPDVRVPFYRVTYFSNYSPNNVPNHKAQTSFLCETSVGANGSITGDEAVKRTIDGLIDSGLLEKSDRRRIVTRWKLRLPYLYPIPTLGRDKALKVIHNYLRKQEIYSIGRFGGWRYEEGNMDHTFLAGYKTASALWKKGR